MTFIELNEMSAAELHALLQQTRYAAKDKAVLQKFNAMSVYTALAYRTENMAS